MRQANTTGLSRQEILITIHDALLDFSTYFDERHRPYMYAHGEEIATEKTFALARALGLIEEVATDGRS